MPGLHLPWAGLQRWRPVHQAAGGALRLWPVFVLGRPVQWIGGDPPFELSRIADQLSGLGPRVSLRDRRVARGAARSAAAGAHQSRREAAALAIQCRVRRLSRADVAVGTGAILGSSPIKKGSEQDIYSDADLLRSK